MIHGRQDLEKQNNEGKRERDKRIQNMTRGRQQNTVGLRGGTYSKKRGEQKQTSLLAQTCKGGKILWSYAGEKENASSSQLKVDGN